MMSVTNDANDDDNTNTSAPLLAEEEDEESDCSSISPAWDAIKLTLPGCWLHLSFRGH